MSNAKKIFMLIGVCFLFACIHTLLDRALGLTHMPNIRWWAYDLHDLSYTVWGMCLLGTVQWFMRK